MIPGISAPVLTGVVLLGLALYIAMFQVRPAWRSWRWADTLDRRLRSLSYCVFAVFSFGLLLWLAASVLGVTSPRIAIISAVLFTAGVCAAMAIDAYARLVRRRERLADAATRRAAGELVRRHFLKTRVLAGIWAAAGVAGMSILIWAGTAFILVPGPLGPLVAAVYVSVLIAFPLVMCGAAMWHIGRHRAERRESDRAFWLEYRRQTLGGPEAGPEGSPGPGA